MATELCNEATAKTTICYYPVMDLGHDCVLARNSADRLYVIGYLDSGELFIERPDPEYIDVFMPWAH